ncbi:patatin-like protein [Aurantiacibacter poecillastricola]|uniref:patatin-like protein n=1 Tax=Aurantiacibacter poecillastricola TaxID=3064385 RepID=UPI00273D31DE|nr:patatin-like protein [Aurantiacibacter sp. 219JJ12-13]MDP5262014.1 patatin-like protein [Aurantiacibacter sp. 219JJ12-13]
MRHKELRIALVCYGGVSLAVYMHGVTKEVWKLARASRAFHAKPQEECSGVEAVYLDLLRRIEDDCALRLRVLPDIITGASAGGINAVFLAQAIHSGRSLEPLTKLWLENADVGQLVEPEARPWSPAARAYMRPIVWYLTRAPGNTVSETVSAETRSEVRRKISSLVRGRWFEPPFSGEGFSRLLHDALLAMGDTPAGAPLLPVRHPLDLLVTATDFRGRLETLRLNSPPQVEEPEHRMPIGFRAHTPATGGEDLAQLCELTFAARATASFPGAFPPLRLSEIDVICGGHWPSREIFLRRIMPTHVKRDTTEHVALVDGSVLNNAPFEGAIEALTVRPAQREVDRRFVYIDPSPRQARPEQGDAIKQVGFFGAIAGSLSAIPREQPIRDNLEVLEKQTREAEKLRRMVAALRPEVEGAVDKLFGHTLFLDRPNRKRLANWRARAQQAAAEQAGYAFHSYAQAKLSGIVDRLADLARKAAHSPDMPSVPVIAARLRQEVDARNMSSLSGGKNGGASETAIAFFRDHDLAFRIRRLRLLARRLSRDWELDPDIPDEGLQDARDAVYRALTYYFAKEDPDALGEDFASIAANVIEWPGDFLDTLAERRALRTTDEEAERVLCDALEVMPKDLRRRVLLTYLGFPFYDVSTLPLLRNEGLTEYDPVKVDRISPEDATAIRDGGTSATLRGTEFFNFGAFFSRAYRENDYLWGRLHGAERMIDLVCSTVPGGYDTAECLAVKRDAFLAICDEEDARMNCSRALVEALRREIVEKLGGA